MNARSEEDTLSDLDQSENDLYKVGMAGEPGKMQQRKTFVPVKQPVFNQDEEFRRLAEKSVLAGHDTTFLDRMLK